MQNIQNLVKFIFIRETFAETMMTLNIVVLGVLIYLLAAKFGVCYFLPKT